MKPWIWLRMAAALQAFGVIGHNLETLSTKPTHGPQEQAVFDAMRGFQFEIMGATRSTWDFYRGYQFSITVTFVLIAVLLWMLSNMSRTAPHEARPLVLTFLIRPALLRPNQLGIFLCGTRRSRRNNGGLHRSGGYRSLSFG